jgi:hypothetical protein
MTRLWVTLAAIMTFLMVRTAVPAASQFRERSASAAATAPTCTAAQIDPRSYGLTTRAQASIVTADRLDWLDGFDVGSAFDALHDLNSLSTSAAERALEIDPNNLLAHALLARQYLVLGVDAEQARERWHTVFDHGGAVVWTATLYDVDARSYFLVAIDPEALRVYRFGELAGPYETHLGVPEFPGPERERLWRAWGGCIDPTAVPEAVVPWSDVREIKAGNWVLYFNLTRRVRIESDRGRKKDVDRIKVHLHGAVGSLEVHASPDPREPAGVNVRTMGIGPLAYQVRVRQVIAAMVDPAGRIALPKASRSAGW